MQAKDDIIRTSLKTASDWAAKQDSNWASRSYSAAMMAMLSKSLICCDNSQAGVEMLIESGARQCLRDLHQSSMELRRDVVSGKLPWSVFGGSYHLIVFSHVAVLLDELQISKDFLELANQQEVFQLGTKFWKAYSYGLSCLARQEVFNPPTLKRRDLERYWILYLNLISQMSLGQDLSRCIDEIDKGFLARNQDSRINDDWDEIEGSGRQPVRWDFRKEAILKATHGG